MNSELISFLIGIGLGVIITLACVDVGEFNKLRAACEAKGGYVVENKCYKLELVK